VHIANAEAVLAGVGEEAKAHGFAPLAALGFALGCTNATIASLIASGRACQDSTISARRGS